MELVFLVIGGERGYKEEGIVVIEVVFLLVGEVKKF